MRMRGNLVQKVSLETQEVYEQHGMVDSCHCHRDNDLLWDGCRDYMSTVGGTIP